MDRAQFRALIWGLTAQIAGRPLPRSAIDFTRRREPRT